MDARVVGFVALFLALGCSEREGIVVQPLPPGLEYPWRGTVEPPVALRRAHALRAAREPVSISIRSATRAASQRLPARDSAPPSGPVDLNSASISELERIPGVGPALASRIEAARPFRRVEDLRRVSGIGRSTLRRIAIHVCVGCGDGAVER